MQMAASSAGPATVVVEATVVVGVVVVAAESGTSEAELLLPLSVADGDWAIADVSIVVVTDSQSDP